MNNDPRIPTRGDFISQFGVVQGHDGRNIINSFRPNVLSCETLYVHGTAFIYGTIEPAPTFSNISLVNGSPTTPSLTFQTNSLTGLYYDPSTQGVGITSNGTSQMIVGSSSIIVNEPITTSGGSNLILNPSGSSIDFTGHNLINVGGITPNPDFYQVIGPTTVSTLNTATAVINTIPTVSGSTYTLQTSISLTDETNATSSGSFVITAKAKNISGTLSIISIDTISALDTSINTASVSFGISGVNIQVIAHGVSGRLINWFGATTITRQLF